MRVQPKINGLSNLAGRVKNILRHLTKAAQRDSHFDKLTAKIPVKEKIVTVTTL